jgi:hypothetical protein
MQVLTIDNTAIVVERVVAVERDDPFSREEAVRVYLEGLPRPIELFVEDPEKTFLEICAAISQVAERRRQVSNRCES